MTAREQYERDMARLLDRLDVRHFTPRELCRVGQIAGDATLEAPPSDLLDNLVPTIVRLESVRRKFGKPLHVTSGYRSEAYNRAVGGGSQSMHLRFNALDVAPEGISTRKLWDALVSLPGARDRFGVARYVGRGFVHFDTRGIVEPGRAAWVESAVR